MSFWCFLDKFLTFYPLKIDKLITKQKRSLVPAWRDNNDRYDLLFVPIPFLVCFYNLGVHREHYLTLLLLNARLTTLVFFLFILYSLNIVSRLSQVCLNSHTSEDVFIIFGRGEFRSNRHMACNIGELV